MIKYLRVNGIMFQEISCPILRLNMKCGSNLIVLEMDSYLDNAYNFFVDILIEMIGSVIDIFGHSNPNHICP